MNIFDCTIRYITVFTYTQYQTILKDYYVCICKIILEKSLQYVCVYASKNGEAVNRHERYYP